MGVSMVDNISAATESFGVPGKILYCNGMTTTEDDAEAHAKTIEELTGIEVELHYNNTTSAKKALTITSKISLGILGMGYGLVADKKTTSKKWIGRGIGFSGLLTFLSALRDLNELDKQKNASAQRLADRVIAYLDTHPLYHMTLIFHSQGADIGYRALEKLKAYKDRINVITIGGMVHIPDRFARRVVNFVNDNDMIAFLAKSVFDPRSRGKTQILIGDRKDDYLECHYSSDYIKRPQVLQTITDLAKVRVYPGIREPEEML
jgi:hypothetical protein